MSSILLFFFLSMIPIFANDTIVHQIIDLRSKKVLSEGEHNWHLKLGDSPIIQVNQYEKDLSKTSAKNEEYEDSLEFLYASKSYQPSVQDGWTLNVKVPESLMNQVDENENPVINDFQDFFKNYNGYVWYRTEVNLSKSDIRRIFGNRNLVLRLGWIGQADAVYWNGELIGATGLSGNTSPNDTLEDRVLYFDKQRFYDIPSDLLDYNKPNTIAVRVYAKHPIRPGLSMGKFYISSREYADRAKYWDDFKKVFVITLTMLLGLFYLFWQFLFRKDEQATVYFALASIFMSLNTLTQSKIIYSILENGVTILMIECITWIMLFHLILSFIVKFSRLSGVRLKSILYLLHLSGVGFIIYIFFQDSMMPIIKSFQIWLGAVVVSTAYLIFVLVQGRKTPSMGTVFFGFLWLGILLLNDIFIDSHLKWYPIQIPMKDYAFGGFSLSIALGIVKNMIQSQNLIQKQKAEKEKLSKYFSPEVMKSIVMDKIKLGGEEKPIATLFSDIVGFTTFSENHTPTQVVERLNFLFEKLSTVVLHYNATLDKYIGDAIMAFWGAPTQHPLDAYRAVACAVEMQKVMREITNSLPEDDKSFQLRIGVNYGPSIVGNIGSQKRMDYTVIGDAVNIAARLESSGVPGMVAVSEMAFLAAGGDEFLVYNEVRDITLKGKAKSVKVYFVTEVKPRI